MRVVSLLASATEIICALDAGYCLVGRSHECDNPPWVSRLPRCSSPTFDVAMPSGDIDREVRRRLHVGEPLYHIDTDLIRSLHPDLVMAQSHCEVCAVTAEGVERAGRIPGARILPLSAGSIDGVWTSILDIAGALEIGGRGIALVNCERARLDRLRDRASTFPRPTVVMLEWTDPIFPMGNWGPDLVDAANGELTVGNRNQHSTSIPSEHVQTADPDVLIVAPCGFTLDRAAEDLPVLKAYSWWKELKAVRQGRVAFADGNLFFNRSGMTITRTAEIIAEILHGLVSGERTEGISWKWMNNL